MGPPPPQPISGHVFRREGKRGGVSYAKCRLPDGLRNTGWVTPEESRTIELVELSHRRIEAVNRRDLEAVMSFFAADPVWDMSPIDMGILEGRDAVRGALKAWW